MRALKICLWVTGILCLLSIVGMFLPVGVVESLAKAFGVQTLPDSPLVMYAVRVMSATYAGVGLFFVILALNPMKYGVMTPFSALCAIFIGVVCAITGVAVRMPALWYLGDSIPSIPCVVLGVLILAFWQKAKQTAQAGMS
jgi:hypothetical protein